MRIALVALLILAVLGASPALSGEGRDKAEAAFFKALYLEQGKRDLKMAEAAYTEFLWEHEEERDLAVRAMLGLARIGAQTGAETTNPNLSEVGRIIAEMKERGEIPKELLPAIEREFEKAKELVESASLLPEVTNQLKRLAGEFALGPKHKSAQRSIEALVPFGDQAVPTMSEILMERDPSVVACAAQVLVRIRSKAASAALLRAVDAPQALYPVQIAEQLRFGEPYHADVFKAWLGHQAAAVRLATVEALAWVTNAHSTRRYDPILQQVMLKALDDPDAAVRRAALEADWGDSLVVLALLKGLNDEKPAIRALATDRFLSLGNRRNTYKVPPDTTGRLLALLSHDLAEVRLKAFYVLSRGAEEATFQDALVRAIRSEDRQLQRQAIGALHKVLRTPKVQDALLFAARESLAGPTTASQAMWFESLQGRIFDNTVPWDLKKLYPLLAQMHRWPLRFQNNPWRAPFDLLLARLKALPEGQLSPQFVRGAYQALEFDRHRSAWLANFAKYLGAERYELARKEIRSDSDYVRAMAAPILLEPGCPHGALLDRSLLEDPVSGVRLAAARALIRRERGEFIDELLEFVAQNPSLAGELTKEVVETLGQPHSYTFVQRTLNLLQKADATYRRAVWLAAPDLPDEAMILRAIRDPDLVAVVAPIAVKRRITAAWPLLIESSSEAAKKAVEEFERYFAAKKAYESLKGAVTGEEDPVIKKVRALAKSEDSQLRAAACHALAMLGDRAAVSMLLDLVKDGEESVRSAALFALALMGGRNQPAGDK